MRKQLIFLILLCSGLSSSDFCQTNTDLLKKISTYKNQDSTRVELLIDACVSGTFDSDKELLRFAKEALQIATKINYPLGQIRATNCIGNYYFQRGDFKIAIGLYFTALHKAEKLKDINSIIISKSNIANIYTRTKDHQKAIALLKECDILYVQNNSATTQNRAALLTNLATVYSNTKQHQLAITTYNQVLAISNKINSTFGQAITYANLGNEYLKINQNKKALLFANKGLQLIEKNNIDFLKTEIYKILGSIYLEEKQYNNAIVFFQKAEVIAKQIEDNETLVEIYNNLKQAYYYSGNYQKAYLIAENFIEKKEKVFSVEMQKNTKELGTKYETEKKEAQIRHLTQEKQIADLKSQQKNSIIYTTLFSLFGIILSFYFFFRKYKTNQQNELLRQQLANTEAQKQANESELKALKSQMNPHFIFNALNSIQEQFMYGDKIIANEQMSDFTTLTRQILQVSGKKKITLATEIEILTKYLSLEKMRFSEDFAYTITRSENIEEEYIKIPPMLVQPFVENSIKHGLLHKMGEKKISIQFSIDKEEEHIICTIQDNGIGRKKSAEIKSNTLHNSFSTASIAQRLQLLYPNENITSILCYEDLQDSNGRPTGTKVTLKLKI